MTQIAVAFIHGVGKQRKDFAAEMMGKLHERIDELLPDGVPKAAEIFIFKPIYWAPVLQDRENILWDKLKNGSGLDFMKLRQFMIDFAADGIAYQPSPKDRQIYEEVHQVVASALKELAATGDSTPLCVIAHSLGTVIISNYFYDLHQEYHAGAQNHLAEKVKNVIGNDPTALEKGQTLASLYTMGSPIAIWSLRYQDFGTPIQVPAPQFSECYSDNKGEWLNFYDEDDIIGYPLKVLNDAYQAAVTRDIPVNVGSILTSWNPACHMEYWTDNNVIQPIAESLVNLWKSIH